MSEVESNTEQSQAEHHDTMQAGAKPIVIEYKKPKKNKGASGGNGKPKYTAGLKDVQVFEGNMVKVAQKAAKSLSKGVDTYQQEREKSAREKTDGAIDDFFYNSAKAASASVKEAADIPVDLIESVNKTPMRKRLRKRLKRTSKAIRMWRL
jgi:hypothetical protein